MACFGKHQITNSHNNITIRTLSPMLVSVTTFATYGLIMKRELQAATVFTALVYFNILRSPIGILPGVINSMITGRVSLTRIQNFLVSEEVDSVQDSELDNYKEKEGKEIAASISNGDFTWINAGDKADESKYGICIPPFLTIAAPRGLHYRTLIWKLRKES